MNLLKFIMNTVYSQQAGSLAIYHFKKYTLNTCVPEVVYLALTFKCQFKCEYCGIDSYPKHNKELSYDEWKGIINKLKLSGVLRIEFSGGEPFLREDLEDLVYFSSKKGLITTVSTNGWSVTGGRIKKLKNNGLNCLCVSLDGASEENHDKACLTKGSFSRVLELINICRKERLPCVISTILRKEIIASREFARILELGEKMHVSGIRLISPLAVGKWLGKDKEILTPEDKDAIRGMIDCHFVPVVGRGINDGPCGVSNGYSIFISPIGEVQPCGYIPYSFGNILKDELPSISKRILINEMFKKKSSCRIENYEFRHKYLYPIEQGAETPIKLY